MQTQNKSSPHETPSNSLSQLAQSMFSSNNNIMLAAIVSLLLVILFVLLLHLYAKCFLSHSHPPPQQPPRRRRRHRRPATQAPPQFQFQFHHFRVEDSPFASKGLDSTTVSEIPMFVYEAEKKKKTEQEEEDTEELECVICLSGFEEGEMGRTLPKCGHAFHVECIDMWLRSHCNCPICRAPVVHQNDCYSQMTGSVDEEDDDGVLQIVIGTPSYEISESENGNNDDNNSVSGSETSYSSPSSSSLLLGCSLKRMLRKVFVS